MNYFLFVDLGKNAPRTRFFCFFSGMKAEVFFVAGGLLLQQIKCHYITSERGLDRNGFGGNPPCFPKKTKTKMEEKKINKTLRFFSFTTVKPARRIFVFLFYFSGTLGLDLHIHISSPVTSYPLQQPKKPKKKKTHAIICLETRQFERFGPECDPDPF